MMSQTSPACDRTGSLTVVGSINADLFVRAARHPQPGETLMGSGGEVLAGGKGANQAVAAALQGAHVTFVGAVGDDAYTQPALRYLESSGVDLTHVARLKDTTTGLAVCTVSDDGENTIIVIPGANAHVDATFVNDRAEAIADADIVLLQGEIPADGFHAAINAARNARVIVNLAPVVEVDRDALLKADPIIANEHEAGLILEQLGSPATSEDPHDLAQALLDAGFASVVLTLGSRGALVADSEGLTDIATPHVTPVDTTGAGDIFGGSAMSQLLPHLKAGRSPAELTAGELRAITRFACCAASLSTQTHGGINSVPDEAAVRGIL